MWALFADGKQVSHSFRTEKEAWHLARKSSLVDQGRLPKGFVRLPDGPSATVLVRREPRPGGSGTVSAPVARARD